VNLEQHLSLGLTTAQDAWSWLLLLALLTKAGSTALLLARKAGLSRAWVERHEPALWWTTKLSALALCVCATVLCRLAGDVAGERIFTLLGLVATLLVAGRVAHQRRAA